MTLTKEITYSEMTSKKRKEITQNLLRKSYDYNMILEKIKKRKSELGTYTIEDFLFDTKNEVNEMEANIIEINEVEKNSFKIFYPDPCNETECAMCGKKYDDHFHHDPNKKHRPFCNNF